MNQDYTSCVGEGEGEINVRYCCYVQSLILKQNRIRTNNCHFLKRTVAKQRPEVRCKGFWQDCDGATLQLPLQGFCTLHRTCFFFDVRYSVTTLSTTCAGATLWPTCMYTYMRGDHFCWSSSLSYIVFSPLTLSCEHSCYVSSRCFVSCTIYPCR
jgi:hypothetical protein